MNAYPSMPTADQKPIKVEVPRDDDVYRAQLAVAVQAYRARHKRWPTVIHVVFHDLERYDRWLRTGLLAYQVVLEVAGETVDLTVKAQAYRGKPSDPTLCWLAVP